jgi:hypothetical protein
MNLFTLFLPLFFSFFTTTTALTHPNPQYRVCTERGGEFVVAQIPLNQIGLCKIGKSYVGTIDLMNFFYENKNDLSILNYSSANTACPETVTATTLEQVTVQLCFFADGSTMDYRSVMNSKFSIENLALNQFLGLAD